MFGLIFWFNDISTVAGYLMPEIYSKRTVMVLFNP